jgi:hypothetical protein
VHLQSFKIQINSESSQYLKTTNKQNLLFQVNYHKNVVFIASKWLSCNNCINSDTRIKSGNYFDYGLKLILQCICDNNIF